MFQLVDCTKMQSSAGQHLRQRNAGEEIDQIQFFFRISHGTTKSTDQTLKTENEELIFIIIYTSFNKNE